MRNGHLVDFSATVDPTGVTLNWLTGFEIDNEAFLVLRSTDPVADFMALGTSAILSEGGSGFGAEYEFLDDTVVAGATYYYLLEDIDSFGFVTTHGASACTYGIDPGCVPVAVSVGSVIPEPNAALVFATGFVVVGVTRRRWR